MKSKIYNQQLSTEEQKIKEQKLAKLKENTSKELQLLHQGTVTEITLGSKTFTVTDPKRIEQLGSIVVRHEESLHELRIRVKDDSNRINILASQLQQLQSEIVRLKEELGGYNNQNYDNY